MKGTLARGKRQNFVHVELQVLGATDAMCPVCGVITIHAILAEDYVSCAVCHEVHSATPDRLERPGSVLCDCGAETNTPISPATGRAMAHHCECLAVKMSEFLRRGQTRTLHARACSPTPDRVHP